MSAPRSSFLRPDSSDRHGHSSPASPSLSGDHDGGNNGNGVGGSGSGGGSGGYDSYHNNSSNPKPTYATFSPANALSGKNNNTSAAAKRRSTILVHQKSPLLLATPPQITRALAYSHPYLLPLNKLAGLITWTTGDPWESFLLVLLWWLVVLYGDTIIRLAGPILFVLTLIGGMYGRRYSPLSTSGWSSEDGVVGGGGGAGGGGSHSRSGGSTTSGSGLGYFLFGIGGGSSASGDAKTTGREATGKIRSRTKNHSLDGAGASHMTSGKGRSGANGSVEAGGNGSGGGGGGGGNGHQRSASEAVASARHQKTLDEIVDTLGEFTARCNLLLEPLLGLTDFLSTQSTATSATTRPALTVLFVRILLCTPFWYLLTLAPMRLVTTRRVALVLGTLILTWHSRVMRVSRTILWRSASIRRTAALVTGLEFEGPMRPSKAPSYVTAGGSNLSDPSTTAATAAAALQSKLSSTKPGRRLSTPRESELTKAIRRARAGQDAGVRFTFILYENQRRWVGLGWTTSLFAYERPAWTDEHNNAVPSKDEFELPEVEDGSKMRWRWVENSRWRVDGVVDDAVRVEKTGAHGEHMDTWDYDGEGGRMGWVYYDNKWQGGRRGQDGWTRWTRRRKWYRDAELVEVDLEDEAASASSQTDETVGANGTATPGDAAQSSISSAQRSSSPAPSQAGTVLTTHTAATSGSEGTNAGVAASTNGAADSKPATKSASIASGGDASAGAIDSVDGGDGSETASIMSTSSKSTRFRAPGLRRRVTDTSSRGSAAPAVTTAATATAIPANDGRSRRSSEAEEEADMLSSSLGVKPHGSGGGGTSSWGYGDEALMSLD
ncbi:Integral peroxisomal membrane peroxin family protein [Sporothrix schenckii 1099-18]|uniref:Integral peroxisomal membrane peroxin family protein n=1 Tax=Sporothrix schenckii 1099-18 TaxID=1397361 RepID=A0A0F2MFU3_SPOSC|nr:Integral peroxisomal membrane peroxin family protein [Sporothrix schenckii 1099-18]KJR87730.1 Integral peroxisomal membrane peroxin family protein [Sporothrix schenckii 1099-18]